MCIALTLKNNGFNLFGRNMDIDTEFGQQVVITPRNMVWPLRFQKPLKQTYAIIGMAFPFNDLENNKILYPLYAEAANEKGLACAGLNFPNTAYYPEPNSIKGAYEITPFEVVHWVLANFTTVKEVKDFLGKHNLQIVNKPIHPTISVAPLHFMIADKNESIVIEPCNDGLKIHDNPLGILTNNPTFDWHLINLSFYQALTNEQRTDVKWLNFNLLPFGQGFGGVGMPGDNTPPSRFIRTAFHKMTSNNGGSLEDLITQFFHILEPAIMVKGSVKVKINENTFHDDITLYTSCIDLDSGKYYYKSYFNHQINVIDMHLENLDGTEPIVFGFSKNQNFNYVNKK